MKDNTYGANMDKRFGLCKPSTNIFEESKFGPD
jgi:hypothetical protein